MLEGNVCVVEGIEEYIREECSSLDIQTCGDTWKKRLLDWKAWEMDWPKRQLIIIGSDITKGIVPLAKEERIWRDVTGWVYQDISAIADRVDVIWYGLNKQLK
jgi:adenosylcobinamide kinase/adenosylcobinamide-phosphate guanylyltransferase